MKEFGGEFPHALQLTEIRYDRKAWMQSGGYLEGQDPLQMHAAGTTLSQDTRWQHFTFQESFSATA